MIDIYFDNASTTKLDQTVLDKSIQFLNNSYGNASSMHSLGREARVAVEKARHIFANKIGAEDNEIYFTSCGSESNNTIIKGIARTNKNNGNHIITSMIEHPSVLNTMKALEKEGFVVTYLHVDGNGIVDVNELEKSITDKTILISIMSVNNELGSIQPIDKIGKISSKYNIPFHTDAVQAVEHIDFNVHKQKISALSMSAHKFNGPKGVGILYVDKHISFKKFIDGGSQERGLRAGTENVFGIAAAANAVQLQDYSDNTSKIKNYLVDELNKIDLVRINGKREYCVDNIINITINGVSGFELMMKLSAYNIYVSSGSACSTNSGKPSHVLKAIGLSDDEARSSIRISIGRYNTIEEAMYLIYVLKKLIDDIRK